MTCDVIEFNSPLISYNELTGKDSIPAYDAPAFIPGANDFRIPARYFGSAARRWPPDPDKARRFVKSRYGENECRVRIFTSGARAIYVTSCAISNEFFSWQRQEFL